MQPAGPIHVGPVALLFTFIVDDENSRNASDVGGAPELEPEGSTRSGDP
jgi:hypothetical protein